MTIQSKAKSQNKSLLAIAALTMATASGSGQPVTLKEHHFLPADFLRIALLLVFPTISLVLVHTFQG